MIEWELAAFRGIVVSVPLLLDMVSLIFSMTVMIISFRVMIFRFSYMSGDYKLEYFIIIVIMFVLSINLLIVMPNMLALLLGWDGLGLSSYLLVIYYINEGSLAAGILTALTNRIGDALLILVVSWAVMGGHWNLFLSSYGLIVSIVAAVLCAAMTKRAQLPFSAWLPAAIAAPTPVSALVHSSTLVTAGIYLIIRFFPSLREFHYTHRFCLLTGGLTCLIAGISAVMERDLKKIIALSTLSQLGVMIVALGLGNIIIAYFHLVTHALFKALLFICAGNIIHSIGGNQDIRLMGGISSSMPLTSTVLNVANLSLCGIPFMAGFYSKDLIVEVLLVSFSPVLRVVLIMLSVCLTSVYSIKLSLSTLWSPLKGRSFKTETDQRVSSVISYIPLLIGAIVRGSSLVWVLNPLAQSPVIPVFLKLFTLTIVIVLGILMFVLYSRGVNMALYHFLTSIWFLKYITSSPLVGVRSHLSDKVNYNEMGWMEMGRGRGTGYMFSILVRVSQIFTNVSLSQMLSIVCLLTLGVFLCLWSVIALSWKLLTDLESFALALKMLKLGFLDKGAC